MKRENTCGSTPKASIDAERRAGGAHRLHLLERDLLDRLGEELADEADRGHGQRAGCRPARRSRPPSRTGSRRSPGGTSAPSRSARAPASVTHGGIRLRAAARPIGSASTMPSAEASTAISQALEQALEQRAPSASKSGGNRRAKKRPRVVEADQHALPRELHLRATRRPRRRSAPRRPRAATTLRPKGSDAPAPGLDRHCSQILAAVDLLQHRRRSRCRAAPSKTTRPPDMPTMRSAKRLASSTSCMLISTGMLARAADVGASAP